MRPLLKFLILTFFFSYKGETAPRVLVTLPPIYSLVAGIMKDAATPILLLDGLISPHHYSLKPSDYRKIANTDVIIWIGPNYESFLEKPIKQSTSKIIQINTIPSLNLLPLRSYNNCHTCSHPHVMEPHAMDPHIWLTPLNAQKIVEFITRKLTELDPENASSYEINGALLTSKLMHLHQELTQKLLPLKNYPFLVFHDGYQYFEKAYDLKGLGALTLDPDIPLSIQRLKSLEAQIKHQDVKCIFGETQFYPSIIKTLAKSTNIKTGKLDPFGTNFIPDETLYFKMMFQLADVFVTCLRDLN